MAATLNTDQFLDVIRKSKLVDEKQLDQFLQSFPDGPPAASRELAQQLVRQGVLTPFQAGQLLLGKCRGFLLANAKYKLLEKLGAGGMGQVFLCEHVRMKRLVALKVLPMDRLKDDQSALERFDREARASAALDHPNIVRAHDLDADGKLHFLVMEFVDGSSLQDIVKKHGPLEVDRACNYIAQAAHGLQHAHEAGWVHRDIKPGNLLVDRAGTVKILDMGLARLFTDDSDNLTKKYEKNAVLGTADYLAPEQATNSSDVDIRADIYSLGATFYYLLTGRGPFDQGTVTQKLIWHQTKPPDAIRSLRPDVPKELEAVINKMMAKKPVHRYQVPSAVAEALRPWAERPIEPPADEEMPRLCPALASYANAGTATALPGLSGVSGPPSTIRSRGRSGQRSTSSSHKTLPRLIPAEWPPWTKWAVIGGGAVAVLLFGILLTVWLTRSDKPETLAKGNGGVAPVTAGGGEAVNSVNPVPINVTPPIERGKDKPKPPPSTDLPAPAPGQWYVARGGRTGGRSDVFPTLADALARATAGHSIRVLVPDLDEQVTVTNQQAGVHIESGLAGPVLWKAPAGAAADTPLLKVESAGAVRVSGFVFDGSRRLNTLIHVSGIAHGFRLEESYLTDAQTDALVFADAVAQPGRAIEIERVRFTTLRNYSEASNENKSAIRPSAVHATGSGSEPMHLVIRWCRFEGMYRSAIALEGSVDGDIRLNRFYSLRNDQRPPEAASIDAVGAKAPSAGPLRLTIASNTMSRFTNLLKLDKLPPANGLNRFTIRSNLIMGSANDAWALVGGKPNEATAKQLFENSAGNICRPNTVTKGLGDAVVPRKLVEFPYIDVTLGSDNFLRYKKTPQFAMLINAGAGGEAAGVPPVD